MKCSYRWENFNSNVHKCCFSLVSCMERSVNALFNCLHYDVLHVQILHNFIYARQFSTLQTNDYNSERENLSQIVSLELMFHSHTIFRFNCFIILKIYGDIKWKTFNGTSKIIILPENCNNCKAKNNIMAGYIYDIRNI